MQSLDAFIAEQNAALDKKRAELAELEKLGPVPGLEPWLIHSVLYGVRHIAFKLVDLAAFVAWAESNCAPVYAVKGHYAIMHSGIPQTRDYSDAKIIAEGFARIDYCTITRETQANFYTGAHRLSFKLPGAPAPFLPIPHFNSYSPRYNGEKRIESWRKPGGGQHQFLRLAVDRQSADLETLLTLDEFKEYFMGAGND